MQCNRLLPFILLLLLMSGCGGGGADPQASAVSKLAVSQDCIGCHPNELSPGTGAPIVQEWQASTHNTKNGAGCADCHEPLPGHPNVCSSCHGTGAAPTTDEVVRNPDAAGKCAKCHGYLLPNDIMMTLSPQHFNNVTASATNTKTRASYVTSRYVGHCTYCHNPHDTSSAMTEARQWAQSLLSTKGNAFASNRLSGTTVPAALSQGTSFCVRCHTTTGFVNFVSVDATGQRFNDQHAWTPSGDKTLEVVGCDACHDNGKGSSYSYAVRSIPAVALYYNYSAPNVKVNGIPTQFPDWGRSNLCVPCHGGRNGIGPMIKAIEALPNLDFSNAPAVSGGHNRVAPVTIARNGFYEFPGLNYSNPIYEHDSVGMGNTRSTGNSGPCVACHMSNGGGHLFYPVTISSGTITAITSQTCAKCHNGSYQQAMTPEALQARKLGYASSLAILGLLRNYSSTTTVAGTTKYPKLVIGGKTNANPSWTAFTKQAHPGLIGPHDAANTMGAVFNYGQVVADPAGFAHNSLYVKRLIYDSIDWLQDGVLGNNDVETAINRATLSPAKTTFFVTLNNPLPGNPAFITSQARSAATDAAFAKVKSDAINWLLGGPGGKRP